MSKPHRLIDHAVQEKAAALLTRRDAGWSSEEAAEFALWRAADPQHEAAVQRIESTQRLLSRLPESPAAAAMLEEIDALCAPQRRVTAIAPWLKVATGLAAAACVAFAAWSTLSDSAPPPPRDSYATVAGEQRTVVLTDGSQLLLNGNSRVEVEFRPSERRVNLQQGEVHFAVAKDAARPFVVAVGVVKVRAVGTAFNVKRERSAIEVVVTEGKVMVSRDQTPAGSAADTDAIFLTAGESVALDTLGAQPLHATATLSPESLREKLAGQAPRLEFSNTPLAEVLARFNRHSRVQLELGDFELAARPVGGTFNGDNAEGFVNLLVATGDIRAERVSDTRIILRKAQ
jgi:transmembrane sensor